MQTFAVLMALAVMGLIFGLVLVEILFHAVPRKVWRELETELKAKAEPEEK